MKRKKLEQRKRQTASSHTRKAEMEGVHDVQYLCSLWTNSTDVEENKIKVRLFWLIRKSGLIQSSDSTRVRIFWEVKGHYLIKGIIIPVIYLVLLDWRHPLSRILVPTQAVFTYCLLVGNKPPHKPSMIPGYKQSQRCNSGTILLTKIYVAYKL